MDKTAVDYIIKNVKVKRDKWTPSVEKYNTVHLWYFFIIFAGVFCIVGVFCCTGWAAYRDCVWESRLREVAYISHWNAGPTTNSLHRPVLSPVSMIRIPKQTVALPLSHIPAFKVFDCRCTQLHSNSTSHSYNLACYLWISTKCFCINWTNLGFTKCIFPLQLTLRYLSQI